MTRLAAIPVNVFRVIGADARHWQIIGLSGLFLLSLTTSSFGATPLALALSFAGAMSAQLLGTAYVGWRKSAPLFSGFEWRSALITAFGVTILLRAADPWIWFAAAFIGIALKFIIRIKGKHIFNPACIGIVVMMLTLGSAAWVSPGQWGHAPLVAGFAIGVAALTLSSAKRLDVAIGFLLSFAAILFARAAWLGDPMAIPIHQLQKGSLIIFAFFMITDPRTIPDSRAGRLIFAAAVAGLTAYFIIGPNIRGAPLMALAALSWLSPVLDHFISARRFEWAGTAATKAIRQRPSTDTQTMTYSDQTGARI